MHKRISEILETNFFKFQIWEDKEVRSKLTKNNSKGLTTLRQKFRKYIKGFEEEMKAFKENPDLLDSDAEADEDKDAERDSDVEIGPDAFKKETSVVR